MGKDTKEKPKTVNFSIGPGINVRLRGKILAKNKTSLFLDYYVGYNKTDDNKVKTQRKIEYLKIYLHTSPKTPEERQKNKENLELAQNIRNKRESERLHNPEGFISPQKKKVNFFDFCQNYEDNYKKGDIRMISGAIRLFKEFTGETYLKPNLINEKLIREFRDYLVENYNGETPTSYFARFKKILKAATEDGLFTKSPAENVQRPKPNDSISKAILMPDEIISMAKAKCGNPEIKRAFLFSLNTGLRFVDIVDLKYKHIKNNQVIKSQSKTGNSVYIDLNESALKLLGEMKKPDESVFKLPSHNACLKTLNNWAGKAKINKRLGWHSARHSFATILLMRNSDINTVSNLLGHSKLEHTQKYTHVVDELKRKAVDKLPKLI